LLHAARRKLSPWRQSQGTAGQAEDRTRNEKHSPDGKQHDMGERCPQTDDGKENTNRYVARSRAKHLLTVIQVEES
jgi:hypothetical protein